MMIKPYSDVKQANYLVENRPKMNTDETRLFLTLVASVNKNDTELNELQIPVSEFAELWGLDENGAYGRLKAALRGLRGKEFFVEGINPATGKLRFLTTSYITTAVYEEGCAYATVKISDAFKPYLLALKNQYTSYLLQNVMSLTSVNAIRNYELLKQYQSLGQRTFTVDEYKQLLKLENKYALNADLRRYVVEPAIEEINANTDIHVSYEFVGRGQRAKLRFTIETNTEPMVVRQELEGQQSFDDLEDQQQVLDGQREQRDNICLGFSAPEFDGFSDEELKLLKTLAMTKIRLEDVEKHKQAYPNTAWEPREQAAADYLQETILMAKTKKPKNLMAYIKACIENDK